MARTYVIYTNHGIYQESRYYRTGYTTLRGIKKRMGELRAQGFQLTAIKYIDYADVYEFGMTKEVA